MSKSDDYFVNYLIFRPIKSPKIIRKIPIKIFQERFWFSVLLVLGLPSGSALVVSLITLFGTVVSALRCITNQANAHPCVTEETKTGRITLLLSNLAGGERTALRCLKQMPICLYMFAYTYTDVQLHKQTSALKHSRWPSRLFWADFPSETFEQKYHPKWYTPVHAEALRLDNCSHVTSNLLFTQRPTRTCGHNCLPT